MDKFKTLQELKATFALMKKEKRQIQEDDSTFDKNIRALRQNLQEVQDKQSTLETGLQKIFEEREWQNIYFGNQSEIRPVPHDVASNSVEIGL